MESSLSSLWTRITSNIMLRPRGIISPRIILRYWSLDQRNLHYDNKLIFVVKHVKILDYLDRTSENDRKRRDYQIRHYFTFVELVQVWEVVLKVVEDVVRCNDEQHCHINQKDQKDDTRDSKFKQITQVWRIKTQSLWMSLLQLRWTRCMKEWKWSCIFSRRIVRRDISQKNQAWAYYKHTIPRQSDSENCNEKRHSGEVDQEEESFFLKMNPDV